MSLQFTKSDAEFLPFKIQLKKVRGNNVDFSTIEITSKKVRGNNVDFSIIKLHRKNVVEATWIFRPAKLCGNDIEIRRNLGFDVSM